MQGEAWEQDIRGTMAAPATQSAWEDTQMSEKGVWGCSLYLGIPFLSHFSYTRSVASVQSLSAP